MPLKLSGCRSETISDSSEPSNSFLPIGSRSDTFDVLVQKYESGESTLQYLQTPPAYISQCSWKLKNCCSFVTSKAMFEAIKRLLQDRECCGVYEQKLQFPRQKLPSLGPLGYQSRPDINDSQTKAVEASLLGRVTCLWGPPGTGKNYTIVTLLLSLLSSEKTERILVAASTHNAVDNVLRAYLHRTSRSSSSFSKPVASQPTSIRSLMTSNNTPATQWKGRTSISSRQPGARRCKW
jgi:hypothetical protein